jgi:ubiquinone/menaquinone biosynthesis C-methylase UbiE
MPKKILDACCGSRMMWFNKSHPDAIYTDIREVSADLCDGRKLEVKPDIIADFTNLPFENESFYLVVLDPPHMKNLGENTWLFQKYGKLFPGWEEQIKHGVNECMRVLKPNGVLIFKWNEHQVKLNEVLSIIDFEPLFGHTSGKHGRTIWLTFMKNEEPKSV